FGVLQCCGGIALSRPLPGWPKNSRPATNCHVVHATRGGPLDSPSYAPTLQHYPGGQQTSKPKQCTPLCNTLQRRNTHRLDLNLSSCAIPLNEGMEFDG